jgi:hypothetical protein
MDGIPPIGDNGLVAKIIIVIINLHTKSGRQK